MPDQNWIPDEVPIPLPNGEICHGPRSKVTFNSGNFPCPCGKHAPLYYSGLISNVPNTYPVCSGTFPPVVVECEQCLKKNARIAELLALLDEYRRDAGEIP